MTPIYFYLPNQLKLTEAPASSCVPAAPTLLTVNDIRLIAPSVDVNAGVAPDGNKK